MIVVDASTIVGAALSRDGLPEKALRHIVANDVLALSTPVEAEIA